MPIQDYRSKDVYDDKNRLKISNSTPVELRLATYANAEGRVEAALAMVFGKSEDGRPYVYLLATDSELRGRRPANDWFRDQLLDEMGWPKEATKATANPTPELTIKEKTASKKVPPTMKGL